MIYIERTDIFLNRWQCTLVWSCRLIDQHDIFCIWLIHSFVACTLVNWKLVKNVDSLTFMTQCFKIKSCAINVGINALYILYWFQYAHSEAHLC